MAALQVVKALQVSGARGIWTHASTGLLLHTRVHTLPAAKPLQIKWACMYALPDEKNLET